MVTLPLSLTSRLTGPHTELTRLPSAQILSCSLVHAVHYSWLGPDCRYPYCLHMLHLLSPAKLSSYESLDLKTTTQPFPDVTQAINPTIISISNKAQPMVDLPKSRTPWTFYPENASNNMKNTIKSIVLSVGLPLYPTIINTLYFYRSTGLGLIP
jgi:hypothetical protein